MTEIFENYEIKNESTFKIGGMVKKTALPSSIDDIIKLLNSNQYDIVLGGCSNVLFSSGFIDKNIIITKYINEFRIEDDRVYVSCGTKGPLISKIVMDNGLSGFEFLIGFPGTFGGMITMNASAHNQSISDCFVCADVFDKNSKKVLKLNKNDMNFSYRNSILKDKRYILLCAEFKLHKGNKEKINEIMKRNIEFRKKHQPSLSFGNAGSIFKNPDNDSAGRLLDLCGMKGLCEGGAKVYDNHANFILNINDANSIDVLTLMYKMYSKVREKYTIELKPEIIFIEGDNIQENKLWEIMN